MPRTKKVQVQEPLVEQNVAPVVEQQSLPPNKDDYMKAKATIKQFRENQKNRPKRPCSEKQLAALKAGREKNKRFAKNQVKPSD